MDALLRANFSHRAPSFWMWLALLVGSLAVTAGHVPRLLGHPAEQAQLAMAQGQRILISVPDGHITGTLAEPVKPEPTPETETPTAHAPEVPMVMPEIKLKTPDDIAPPAKPDNRHPSARIPARDHPEVKAQDLPEITQLAEAITEPAPKTGSAETHATPELTPAATETKTPAEPAAEVKTPEAKPAPETAVAATPETKVPEAAEPTPVPAPLPASAAVTRPLPEAPIANLVEDTKDGPLPARGKDGMQPLRAYAKKPAADIAGNTPRIALVLTQVGLNASLIEPSMALPEDVSLAISPYTEKAANWLTMARVRGHEALLDLPMEPKDFPISDAGPLALSPREKAEENTKRLHMVLAKAQGYVGVIANPNEHFLSQAGSALPVLKELGSRGLLLIGSNSRAAVTLSQTRAQSKITALSNSIALDASSGEARLRADLGDLENAARKDGQAVGILRPTPMALPVLAAWMKEMQAKGIRFVPSTALLPPEKEPAKEPAHTTHEAHE